MSTPGRKAAHWRPEASGITVAASTTPFWYKDAVFYELAVRAFADGNGLLGLRLEIVEYKGCLVRGGVGG